MTPESLFHALLRKRLSAVSFFQLPQPRLAAEPTLETQNPLSGQSSGPSGRLPASGTAAFPPS